MSDVVYTKVDLIRGYEQSTCWIKNRSGLVVGSLILREEEDNPNSPWFVCKLYSEYKKEKDL